MRSIDWAATPLGPVSSWSPSLRSMVGLLLANRFPMLLWWGPEHVQLYNDAYRPVLGSKHPDSMGQPGAECWAEIWPIIGPLVETPYTGGPATWSEDLFLEPNRHGFVEETHFTIAYSPVPDESAPAGIGGVLATVHEITAQVVQQRRVVALHDLGARAMEAKTAEEACAIAAKALAQHGRDVPFALIYLVDAEATEARLAAAAGVDEGGSASPLTVDLRDPAHASGWPLARAVRLEAPVLVDDLAARFPAVPPGPWTDPPRQALVLPIPSNIQHRLAGVLVAGVSVRLELDGLYRSFFDLVTAQVATAIANARAYADERRRAEALAEIDRAKTLFFSNVSHEFRTPLTLMLGPLEDLLQAEGDAEPGTRAQLAVVHRNGLRLLKLVNTLLDFARIESERVEAVYEPVDLAAFTAELASVFRSAVEKAGLRFAVECPPLPEPVHVDREMWEKIVLNLISNALKFTFEGEIRVAVRAAGGRAELQVSDTGIGIAADDLPHLFERFHRVRGARSRTHEGSGIGLALTQELVRLHGGTVSVASEPDRGTAFTVAVPLGTAHLAPARIGAARTLSSTTTGAAPYVEEALRWLPDDIAAGDAPTTATPATPAGARVLLADDNADMREYLRRLLSQHWTVEAVADGTAALAAARAHPPDLILTDVMMPGLDGFELLHALRADEATRAVPVILLSARAGEESRVEGLGAGADDYLVKPFSARELVARVGTHLALAQARRRDEAALRAADRAKNEFLAMLSHELRNPLGAIASAVKVLEAPARGDATVARATAVADRQVRHLTRLVEDLLDVTRVTAGKIALDRRAVDLAAVAERVVAAARAAGQLDQHAVSIATEPAWVDGDETRLEQVVANLLGNAVKFTPAGGSVHVRVWSDAARAGLEVADTGVGIPADLIGRIFDLFVQGEQAPDRAHGGLGIGLTLVQRLVNDHGGTIAVRSGGGEGGSTFTVRLPASAAPAHRATDEPVPAIESRRRILLIEDDDDSREMLRLLLEQQGHDVVAVASGQEGIELIAFARPEVTLIDIGLPMLDGYEVARRIRARPGVAPVLVALTGYGSPEARERAAQAGFDVHLVKPVDPARLAEVIAAVPVPAPR